MQLYDRCIRSVAQVQQVKSNRPGRKREFCKREIYTYLYKIYIQMAAVRCNNALRALSWSWGAFSSEPGVSSGNMHATRNSSGVSRVEEESTAVSLYKSPRRHHFHYIIITWSDQLRGCGCHCSRGGAHATLLLCAWIWGMSGRKRHW